MGNSKLKRIKNMLRDGKLTQGTLSTISQLENYVKEIESHIHTLKGPQVLICGYCYREPSDHKEYPTYYCHTATQMYIYKSEWTKGGGKKYVSTWNRDEPRYAV